MPLLKKKKKEKVKVDKMAEGESVQTTRNQHLSNLTTPESTLPHTPSHHTLKHQVTSDNSDYDNTTDDPDDVMTSDDEGRRGKREGGRGGEGRRGRGRLSDADTLPLEDDDDVTADLSDTDADKTHRRKRRKSPDDDNALLLSDRHVPSSNHNNYESHHQNNKPASTSGGGVKGDEDGWSKDLEAVEEGRRGWETRCVVFLVVMVTTLLIVVIFFLFSSQANVEEATHFRFGNYFSDHMVLQGSPQHTVIWGYGPRPEEGKGQRVLVQIYTTAAAPLKTMNASQGNVEDSLGVKVAEENATVLLTAAGNTWRVSIGPLEERGPFIVSASLIGEKEGHEIRLYDVMVGDVWLCTGHSRRQNNIFKVSNFSYHLQKDDKNSKYFRFFSVFPAKSDLPWSDIHVVDISWSVANVQSLQQVRDKRIYKTSSFPGTCWFFGQQLQQRLKRPVGVVGITYSDSRLLEWAPVEVADACGVPYSDASSRIWNGMLHPLINMPVTGMVWQQAGVEEEEKKEILSHTQAHACLLKGFVQQWRNYSASSWARGVQTRDVMPLLPFGVVQSLPSNSSSDDDAVATLRWLATGGHGYLPNNQLPNSFLACPIDLPDSSQPMQQQELADRLFKGASHVAYGNKKMDYPFPVAWVVMTDGRVKVSFNQKIKLKSSEGVELQNQSCKADKSDHWERATISAAGSDVIISGFNCQRNYLGFRYAWLDAPCPFMGCAIYADSIHSSLPAPPFIRLGLSINEVGVVKGRPENPLFAI